VIELGQDDVDWEDADLVCLHKMPKFHKVREYFEERFGGDEEEEKEPEEVREAPLCQPADPAPE
jgi:hypothetical protein